MKTQNQWLFEVPFPSEAAHYTNAYFNSDALDEWEIGPIVNPYTLILMRAALANRKFKKKLGWQKYLKSIEQLLGFVSSVPTEMQLADAIFKWQNHQEELKPDGILNSETWRRMQVPLNRFHPGLVLVPEVNTLLSQAGQGYYSRKPPLRRFGVSQTIAALKSIGVTWQKRQPDAPRIQISDISFPGGGKMPPHSSHQRGIDVDIWPMRNDGKEASVNFKTQGSKYSPELTQELVKLLCNNGVLEVCDIYFDDKRIKGVRKESTSSHVDHLHVRFFLPGMDRRELGCANPCKTVILPKPSPQLPSDYSCVMPRTHDFELENFELENLELENKSQFCRRVSITNQPIPCRFYTIQYQIDAKGLIDLAGRAYGEKSYSLKVKLAQWINNHPYNRRFWQANLATGDFPQGRIAFSPIFTGDIERQARATGQAASGRSFATIFIPPPPSWLQQTFSSC